MTRCSSPVPWIAPNSDGQVYSAWPSCTSDVRVSIKLQKLVKVVVLPVRFPKDYDQVFIACAVDCAELWRPVPARLKGQYLGDISPTGGRRRESVIRRVSVCPHGVYENYVCTCLRDEGTEHAPPLRECACIAVSPMHDPSPPPSATHCDAVWLGGLVASSTTRVGNLAFSDPQLESSRSSNAIQGRGLPPPLSTLYVSKLRRLRHTRVDPHLRLKEQYHSRGSCIALPLPPRPGPLFWAHMGAGPLGKLSKLDPPPAQPQFPLLAICLAIAIAFVLEMGRGVPWPFQDILAGKWEHQPPAGLSGSRRFMSRNIFLFQRRPPDRHLK
ncbi:hypothetical protein B0H14DRAFT_2632464 [Mycena olivaceomarginata]|nr:hypothetical protein B0H14DRAFT_2632464 [Mycena olivaceomarginata]